MSLVRDYGALIESKRAQPRIRHASSRSTRARSSEDAGAARSLEERFDVVPGDPTQAAAVAPRATGRSYIIQGPPGTGKSQTITNLIADYVARGKRVLFVCEKRAAIDVVYHRLRQQGLDRICCLIHDSQADKKAFVKDLKETYEALARAGRAGRRTDASAQALPPPTGASLAARCASTRHDGSAGRRGCAASVADAASRSTADRHRSSRRTPPSICRSIALGRPPLVARLEQRCAPLARNAVFAQHPSRGARRRCPRASVRRRVREEIARSRGRLLDRRSRRGSRARRGARHRGRRSLAASRRQLDVKPLVRARAARAARSDCSDVGRSGDPPSKLPRAMREALAEARQATRALAREAPAARCRRARAGATASRQRSSPSVRLALKPAWWQLRRVTRARRYDFAQHAIAPTWVGGPRAAPGGVRAVQHAVAKRGAAAARVRCRSLDALSERARSMPGRAHSRSSAALSRPGSRARRGDDASSSHAARALTRSSHESLRRSARLRRYELRSRRAARASCGGRARSDISPTCCEPLRNLGAVTEHARLAHLRPRCPVSVRASSSADVGRAER